MDWVTSIASSDEAAYQSSVCDNTITLPVFTALTTPNMIHLIDSGATLFCTPYMTRLQNVHATKPLTITVANRSAMITRLKGEMSLTVVSNDGSVSTINLLNVYYCPEMPFTLISVSMLDNLYDIRFNSGVCTITDVHNRQLCSLTQRHFLYYITESYANVVRSSITLYELHKRMGHISYTYLKKLLKLDTNITTLEISDFTEIQCEDCTIANIQRNPIPKKRTSQLAKAFGDHFHIDIFGKLRTTAIGGYLYLLTIVDDATRWTTMAPLKTKDEAYVAWVKFATMLFTQYGIKVKTLQSDNDTVFLSEDFTAYLESQGTLRRLTVHDTPQQNGVAERTHQTIIRHVRVCLESSKLPDKLWYYAVLYSTFCTNRSPRSAINFETPYFRRYKTHYNIDNMHSFGAPCIFYNEETNKLHPRGTRAKWLGFAEHSKGHYIWTGTRVSTERNIQFVDDMSQIEGEELPQENQTNDDRMDVDTPQTTTIPFPVENKERRQSIRQKRKTRKARGLEYDEVDTNVAFFLTEFNAYYADEVSDPVTFNDVLKHPYKDNWFNSMQEEIAILEQRKTWSYVTPPPNANIIGTRFVYKTKEEHGQKKRLKSRLVVQGYAQKEGIDYYANDLFAPVAKLSSMRSILSWAATNDYEIIQLDIKSAYLYGELNSDEEIYIRPPPGNLLPNLKPGQVLQLNKALYGLKQAGRRWYKTLCNILDKLNLTKSSEDNAVFYRRYQGQLLLVLFVHVDDITVCSINSATTKAFKDALNQLVSFSDGGDIHWLLGIEIKRNREKRKIYLRQKHYIETIIKRYGFTKEFNKRAPMQTGQILQPTTNQSQEEKEFMEGIPYMALVGALRYAADSTRPDIAYCTGQLARYLLTPSRQHFEAAKHCFQYLKATSDYWLTLGGTEPTQLVGFADSDGMTTPGSKPIMGYMFKLGSALVSWSSKRATLVALSVTEAELIALAYAAQEAITLKRLINELFLTSTAPTTIYTDSASSLAIINSPEEQNTQRTKHFDIRKNFFADRIEKGFINLKHVTTDKNQADLLTKSLSTDKLKRFMELLHLSA